MIFRIPVTIHGVQEKFLIVCLTGNETIQWLCETAYNRYNGKYIDKIVLNNFVARRTADRSLLSLDDRVQQVLNDNQPIEIGKMRIMTGIIDELFV